MVATSKMRRAQERMKLARPYADKIRRVIGNLAQANPDYRHPFLETRDAKNVGFIVISTDRGLAGGLNAEPVQADAARGQGMAGEGLRASACA